MKQLIIILLIGLSLHAYSENHPHQTITTEPSEVTVFIDGAQVTRQKSIKVNTGISILKFTGLSPFIEAQSIQVKAEGALTVLSVNQQQDYLNDLEKPEALKSLEDSLLNKEEQLQLENTYQEITREEILFLQANKSIGGRSQQLSVSNLEQASSYYGKRLTELKLKEIEQGKKINQLKAQKRNIQNQIQTLTSQEEYPAGEIRVKVEAKQSVTANFELSYLVNNASWFPSYDVRAKDITEPVQLIYKANVRQDTKVDWKNVKLSFSSSDPNRSGVAPQMQTYFLNYHLIPPSYQQIINEVTGQVTDSKGQALPGTNVVVEGTTIGTVTDSNGRYSLTVPNQNSQLTFSFIGFTPQTIPVRSSVIHVRLQEDQAALDEVVVVGYAGNKKSNTMGAISIVEKDNSSIKIRGVSSIPLASTQVEKQTTVNFEIKIPYSIPSDNKNYMVDMATYDLPAMYQYYSIPKVNDDAFLLAKIINWEQYNLLAGEANVFFEDTYVGKSLLNAQSMSDTLNISLGIDKKVSVTREKKTDFTSRQLTCCSLTKFLCLPMRKSKLI